MLPLASELAARCASDGRRSRKYHVVIFSSLETKLEAAPVELGEHWVGVVLVSNLSHSVEVLLSIGGERLLPLSSVAHVDEISAQALRHVDLVLACEQRLGPGGNSEVILGASPRGSDLPPLKMRWFS